MAFVVLCSRVLRWRSSWVMAFQPADGLTNLSALLRRRGGHPLMVPVSPSRLKGGWYNNRLPS